MLQYQIILLGDKGNKCVWTYCTTRPRSHSTVQRLGLNPRSPIASPMPLASYCSPWMSEQRTEWLCNLHCVMTMLNWIGSVSLPQAFHRNTATRQTLKRKSSDNRTHKLVRCRFKPYSQFHTVMLIIISSSKLVHSFRTQSTTQAYNKRPKAKQQKNNENTL